MGTPARRHPRLRLPRHRGGDVAAQRPRRPQHRARCQHVGSIHPFTAVASWLILTAILSGVFVVDGLPWWRAPVCAVVALLALAWLIRRAVRRFGGVAGDVYGAGIEIVLALMLLTAT